MATLPDLLKQMVELQGSDLHLSIGSVPHTRVHGENGEDEPSRAERN